MADSKQTAKSLLGAETETKVQEIIEEVVATEDVEWTPLGGTENNSGIVDIQKGTPVGALSEIIVNAFDAILIKRYIEEYGEGYDNEVDLNTYLEAADHLLEDEPEEEVRVIADGAKSSDEGPMNITVMDTGKGQSTEDFSNFVDILEVGLNKQSWPFIQGMFGIGSQAILRFCGDDQLNGTGYKFIASADFRNPGKWTWTLIRRNPEVSTTFEYLTLDGDFPTFEGEVKGQEYGTAIKHFNFQLDSKSEITKTAALRGKLDLELLENPLPITLEEQRYDRDVSGVFTRETWGAYEQLKGHPVVKNHFEETITSSRLPDWLQETPIDIFLFHDNDELNDNDDLPTKSTKQQLKGGGRNHQQNTIIFAANGEKHAAKSHYHLRSRCDLYDTAKDTKVIVDLSHIAPEHLREIFDPSRDGLHDASEVATELEEQVINVLQNHDGLRQEEMRRRQSSQQEGYEDQWEDFMENLISQNPHIADYLDSGKVIINEHKIGDEGTYDVTTPPTEFELIETYRPRREHEMYDGPEGEFTAEVPENGNAWQRFKLDAPNGYFNSNRDGPSGTLEVAPNLTEEVIESWGLKNGILAVQLSSNGLQEGTEVPIRFTVTVPDDEDLQSEFTLEITEENEGSDNDTTTEEETGSEQLALPDIRPDEDGEVVEDGGVVAVRDSETKTTIWVNMEADPLLDFLSNNSLKQAARDFAKQKWLFGIGLYTFGTLHAMKEEAEDAESEIEAEKQAQTAAKGFAPFFLGYHFDEDTLSEMTTH